MISVLYDALNGTRHLVRALIDIRKDLKISFILFSFHLQVYKSINYMRNFLDSYNKLTVGLYINNLPKICVSLASSHRTTTRAT